MNKRVLWPTLVSVVVMVVLVGTVVSRLFVAPANAMPGKVPALPAPSSPPAYAVGVSANHRYLVDQYGKPFLLIGDAPQCMATNLSLTDMNYFFAQREQEGFDAMWADILCGPYTGGRADYATYDGIVPFTTPGDLSTPNPKYFARIDAMVKLAAAHGMTLLLEPAETGSFRDLLRSNGVTKDFAYGEYIGTRYRSAPNIIWLSGNDYQTNEWASYDPYTTALARGLRSANPRRLQTVELNYPVSLSTDNRNWAGLININSAYTYAPTYADVLRGYDRTPSMPVVMIEANYEGENNTGGPPTGGDVLRRQEYWTMLSGATGQVYGDHYTWGFQFGPWKDQLNTTGSAQLTIMVKLLRSIPWYDLVPDQTHRLVTSGFGTPTSAGPVSNSNYVAAAMTTDRNLAIAYLPTPSAVTVDMSRFSAPVTARWFDPTNGRYTPVTNGLIPNIGSHLFKPNGLNSQGDGDWVLVLSTKVIAS